MTFILSATDLKSREMSTLPAINDGDTSWVIVATALVLIMIPGLGYFYSGLASHKSALSLIFLSVLSLATVSIQWFLFGFSLAFASDGGSFIGNFKNGCLVGIFDQGSNATYLGLPQIPFGVFMVFQGMFAAITPAIAFGGAAERIKVLPCLLFLFLWSTIVYDFIAYWSWAPNGWLKVLGSFDFAGGTPVHISSGAAGLAFALVAGKRLNYGNGEFKPHNLSSVFLGTALLWFGWLGFNGGSELAANSRAIVALVNTNLAASVGGLTWTLMDYRHGKKLSAFSFCSGVVAGLVAITPGCGFVHPWASLVIGILGAVICNAFVTLKANWNGFDDALDAFGVHCVGGITGNILTGIFASKAIIALDGTVSDGGWVDGHWMQVLYQLAGSVAGLCWSFTWTYLICYCMNKIPVLSLRLSVDDEVLGSDRAQLGETAYDYIEAAVNFSSNNLLQRAKPSDIELREVKSDP